MRYAFVLLLILVGTSCKESKKKQITRLVNEWSGKEISFPADMVYTKFAKDTINYQMPKNDFTILFYIDSVGCTSCKLQLLRWKELMNQLDSISGKTVDFQFIFHPKNIKDLSSLLKRDGFDHPVCLDNKDHFNILNKFPAEEAFHSFLLDKHSKVIAIGNPVQNPKIKELYTTIITGKKAANDSETTTSINKTVIDFGQFDWHEPQKSVFILQNEGANLLVVNDIMTSCGCISVEYSKEPVRSGEFMEIAVLYKADRPENFYKTITVHCNIDNSPLALNVRGMAVSNNNSYDKENK